MKLYIVALCIFQFVSFVSFAQNDDFATITIKASGLPITIKVNGEIIDKIDARNTLILPIAEGEKKTIILEDSEGKKFVKQITAAKEDKGKNFFVQFPAKSSETEPANEVKPPDQKDSLPSITKPVNNIQLKTEIKKSPEIKEKPANATLALALKNNNDSDLRFFINKNNIHNTSIDELPILLYALQKNCKAPVIKYLVETADAKEDFINPPGYTFPAPYQNYYLMPLTKACINGDTNVINILIDANARFYPEGLDVKSEKDQSKFLWQQFGWNKEVRLLISRRMPTFPNPDMEMADAVKSIEKNMVLIEGGTFNFGCKGDRADCGNAWPMVEATVDSFYLTKYEITQQIWETIMESNPSVNSTCADCPMENISWNEIQTFLQKINNLSEKKYRLHTEKEWEFAAKGGVRSNNYKYAGSNVLDSVAWTKQNATNSQPVGKKSPNELDLFDMSGNVFEWCSSYYSENLEVYKTSPNGASIGTERIIKGGSFGKSDFYCEVVRRNGVNADTKSPQVGFRLAYDK